MVETIKHGLWEILNYSQEHDDLVAELIASISSSRNYGWLRGKCHLIPSQHPMNNWECVEEETGKRMEKYARDMVVDCKEKRVHTVPADFIAQHETISELAGTTEMELMDHPAKRFLRIHSVPTELKPGAPSDVVYYSAGSTLSEDLADKCLCELARAGILGMSDTSHPAWTYESPKIPIKNRCDRSRD